MSRRPFLVPLPGPLSGTFPPGGFVFHEEARGEIAPRRHQYRADSREKTMKPIKDWLLQKSSTGTVVLLSVALGASLAGRWDRPAPVGAADHRASQAEQHAVLETIQDAFTSLADRVEPTVVSIEAIHTRAPTPIPTWRWCALTRASPWVTAAWPNWVTRIRSASASSPSPSAARWATMRPSRPA